ARERTDAAWVTSDRRAGFGGPIVRHPPRENASDNFAARRRPAGQRAPRPVRRVRFGGAAGSAGAPPGVVTGAGVRPGVAPAAGAPKASLVFFAVIGTKTVALRAGPVFPEASLARQVTV